MAEREAFRKLVCPQCHKSRVIRRILYGMPGRDFDHRNFALGGCVMWGGGLDPDVACSKCDWSGFRNELDTLISKEMLDMSQGELFDDEGEVLYYWDVTDVGVHFEIETYAIPGSEISMDTEVQFTVAESEFGKIYELFKLDPADGIASAIQKISDSGRGLELWDAFEEKIKVIDKSVWMS